MPGPRPRSLREAPPHRRTTFGARPARAHEGSGRPHERLCRSVAYVAGGTPALHSVFRSAPVSGARRFGRAAREGCVAQSHAWRAGRPRSIGCFGARPSRAHEGSGTSHERLHRSVASVAGGTPALRRVLRSAPVSGARRFGQAAREVASLSRKRGGRDARAPCHTRAKWTAVCRYRYKVARIYTYHPKRVYESHIVYTYQSCGDPNLYTSTQESIHIISNVYTKPAMSIHVLIHQPIGGDT